MPGPLWHFADCEFDESRLELRVRGRVVDVEARPLGVLKVLLRRRGEIVTKEELLDAAWPGVTVVDGSLATAVSKLRRAIDDPRVIVTRARVGYRIGVPVTRVETPVSPSGEQPTPAGATVDRSQVPPGSAPSSAPSYRWLASAAAVMGVALLIGALAWGVSPASGSMPATRVSVLPFESLGTSDRGADFLRVALADEAATLLSHARGVVVTPVVTRSLSGTTDPLAAGREAGADSVLTGHLTMGHGRLAVTLEAMDTSTGGMLWRDSFDVAADNLMAAQTQLALRIRSGLTPRLGGVAPNALPAPANSEAYTLFLRSTGLSLDVLPNREAIAMLEQAVDLDRDYSPAWHALSRRYYVEARYGGGGDALIARGLRAERQAVAIDPDFPPASAGLVVALVERGALGEAFTHAASLLRAWPGSADAQFSMSYALRFAGRLADAGRHCDMALLLDSRTITSGLRSCAVVFLLRNDYARAVEYLHLDEGTDFERGLTFHLLVRQGKVAEALRLGAPAVPGWSSWSMLEACLQGRPQLDIDRLADTVVAVSDPESNYFSATHLAYCGKTTAATAMLERAIQGGYCAYPALVADPLLEAMRATPAYARLRAQGAACQQRFLEQVRSLGTAGLNGT